MQFGVILCVAITLTVCFGARWIGLRLGVMDRPDGNRKLHARTTPQVGGLAVGIPIVLFALVQAFATEFTPLYATIAVAGAALLVLGTIDDRRHIRPALRLGASFLICVGVLYAVPGLQVAFLKFTGFASALYFDSMWVWVFSLICLVGLQNAINMADGKNGLVVGLSLIWSALLWLHAPEHMRLLIEVLVLGLAITFAFNLAGRLFLGDGGTYTLGGLIGLLAIYCYVVGVPRLTADTVMLWFLIPVLDCLRLIVSRLRQGRSPFSSDLNHLHHILAELMPWRWGLAVYLALVGVPALLALAAPERTLELAFATSAVYAVMVAVGGRVTAARRLMSTL
jgi:UDP-GlcNAc:undecaprenyl-phosphate/decaprenyl-phosphate GlcNAc-1-phosphate transferase